MDIIEATLNDRDKGVIPVSIGTSLALETALNQGEGANDDPPKILDHQVLWVNVRTLYRNLLGSLDSDTKRMVSPEALAVVMSSEMQIIEAAVNQTTRSTVPVVFYHCSYMGLHRRYPYGQLRTPTTPLQVGAADQERETLEILEKDHPPVDYRMADLDLEDAGRKVLMLTHYPVDLLNRYRFTQLTLLESHTGTFKSPLLWNTKLYNGKRLNRLPFDRMTLQVFGDGVQFRPGAAKLRQRLIDLAETRQWTAATTKALILSDIHHLKDPVLEATVIKLY